MDGPPAERLHVAAVLGDCRDPAFASRLHALEHDGLLDTLWLPRADMARHRLLVRSAAGREVAIALPRSQALFDGAVLQLDPASALVLRAEAERWLRLDPESAEVALALGYHAGNLHWRVRFDGPALLVALDGAPEPYLARLGPLCDRLRVEIVEPAA